MIVDTSAIVAIVMREPGHEQILAKLGAAGSLGIGVPTLVETGLVLSSRLRQDARGLLSRLLAESGMSAVPFGEVHLGLAIEAWLRFGKGRHPAALNLGDCLSYAVARVAGEPLLCTGDDFARTDLEIA
jgi:ribonuclease VapC